MNYFPSNRGRGSYRGRRNNRFFRNTPRNFNFNAGLRVEDFIPSQQEIEQENKELAVRALQQSVKKVTVNNFSVEAQYETGTPQGCPNLLWVPTTWNEKALFGCFWLGSAKRRNLDDKEIAINLFVVATILALRSGYSGIYQLAFCFYTKWVNNFLQFARVGNDVYTTLVCFLVDSFCGAAGADYVLGSCNARKQYDKQRQSLFTSVQEKLSTMGKWFLEMCHVLAAGSTSNQLGNAPAGLLRIGLFSNKTKNTGTKSKRPRPLKGKKPIFNRKQNQLVLSNDNGEVDNDEEKERNQDVV